MTENSDIQSPPAIIYTGEQTQAIQAEPPQLIIAGAGTGKTTVLTAKLIEAIRSDPCAASHVLGLTFTDKAAAEMKERAALEMAKAGIILSSSSLHISTFHSFGESLIKENLVRFGIDPGYRLATRGLQWQVLYDILDDLTFEHTDIPLSTGELFDGILKFISTAKDHLVTPDDLRCYLDSQSSAGLSPEATAYWDGKLGMWWDMLGAYERYQTALAENHMLDFGDLLLLPAKLLESNDVVRRRCRDRYRHIFVDEYQDTNAAQARLLEQLINPDRPHIVVIGDDDQAIYGWRGAIVRNILQFGLKPVFGEKQLTRSQITINRRSSPPILQLADAVISRVENRYSKTLKHHHETPAEIGHFVAENNEAESEWIACKIKSLYPEAENLTGRKKNWGAFGVLCRKRSFFQPIARALEKAGIPYEVVGGTGFYHRPEIKDIVAYLSAICDPLDSMAFARILTSKRFQLSDRDIYFLSRWRKRNDVEIEDEEDGSLKATLFDAICHAAEIPELSNEARRRLGLLKNELEDYIRQAADLSVVGSVSQVLDRTGYLLQLESDPSPWAAIALMNIQKLLDLATQFDLDTKGSSLESFVQYVKYEIESEDVEGEVRPEDEDSNTVKVMSVHQSKGLEFPFVFVPGLAKDKFPSRSRSDPEYTEIPPDLRDDAGEYPSMDFNACSDEKRIKKEKERIKDAIKKMKIDEERRLCYVALTRAQYKLFLSRPLRYIGNKTQRDPSMFWDELMETGLSMPVSVIDGGAELVSVDEAAEEGDRESPAKLLLSEDEAKKWLEGIIDGDTEGRWEAMKQEADDIIERIKRDSKVPREAEPEPSVVFSYSALSSYQECPRKYQYLYVDRLPTKPAPWATLGTSVHELIRRDALEQHVVFQPDFDELTGSDEWGAGEPGEDERSLFEKYKDSEYGRRKPKYVEQPFTLRLGTVVIKGRIDRIDELPDGSWEIVDFKTSQQPKTKKQAFYDLQLRIYALAAREIWGIEETNLTCTLYYLRHSKAVSVKFTRADLEATADEITRLADSINERRFPQRMDTTRCRYCDFVHICGWFGEW